jgi:hypothetical protein
MQRPPLKPQPFFSGLERYPAWLGPETSIGCFWREWRLPSDLDKSAEINQTADNFTQPVPASVITAPL